MSYRIGDVVFWAHPPLRANTPLSVIRGGARAGKVLVLALGAEIGFEVDAVECRPTGQSNPQRGREYRETYFRNHP